MLSLYVFLKFFFLNVHWIHRNRVFSEFLLHRNTHKNANFYHLSLWEQIIRTPLSDNRAPVAWGVQKENEKERTRGKLIIKCNLGQKIIFSKIQFSYKQKPEADLNLWSAVLKPNTSTTMVIFTKSIDTNNKYRKYQFKHYQIKWNPLYEYSIFSWTY